MKLTETVTIEREVPHVIKDLVLFARYMEDRPIKDMSNAELIAAARCFYDNQHGED